MLLFITKKHYFLLFSSIFIIAAPDGLIVLRSTRSPEPTVEATRTVHTENKRYGHTAHTLSHLMSNVLIRDRFISISSGFQMTDNNSFLAVSPIELVT